MRQCPNDCALPNGHTGPCDNGNCDQFQPSQVKPRAELTGEDVGEIAIALATEAGRRYASYLDKANAIGFANPYIRKSAAKKMRQAIGLAYAYRATVLYSPCLEDIGEAFRNGKVLDPRRDQG